MRIRKINSIAYSDGALGRDINTANGGLNWATKETTMGALGKETVLAEEREVRGIELRVGQSGSLKAEAK